MFFIEELFNPFAQRERDWAKRHVEEVRIPACVPWTPDIKWARELNIKAETWPRFELFDIPATAAGFSVIRARDFTGKGVESPDGTIRYLHMILPRGEPLTTSRGNQKGTVLFDGDVVVPALFMSTSRDDDGTINWRWVDNPWMSITPMEVLTLRAGTRFARGKVIVGGLGLGYQLIEVCKRRQVKEVVVVERSQALVDFIMPALKDRLGKPVEVVVGDAYKVIPEMQADVCLLDIFKHYGSNRDYAERITLHSPGIGKFWIWGSATI